MEDPIVPPKPKSILKSGISTSSSSTPKPMRTRGLGSGRGGQVRGRGRPPGSGKSASKSDTIVPRPKRKLTTDRQKNFLDDEIFSSSEEENEDEDEDEDKDKDDEDYDCNYNNEDAIDVDAILSPNTPAAVTISSSEPIVTNLPTNLPTNSSSSAASPILGTLTPTKQTPLIEKMKSSFSTMNKKAQNIIEQAKTTSAFRDSSKIFPAKKTTADIAATVAAAVEKTVPTVTTTEAPVVAPVAPIAQIMDSFEIFAKYNIDWIRQLVPVYMSLANDEGSIDLNRKRKGELIDIMQTQYEQMSKRYKDMQ
jgi:hypothetical protein